MYVLPQKSFTKNLFDFQQDKTLVQRNAAKKEKWEKGQEERQ